MTLAEPAFLLLLLLIPLLALGAWLAEKQRRTAWQKLVAPRLRRRLAAPASSLSRWLSLGCGLLSLILIIVCLAQPIAGEKETTSLVKGRNILIAIDASRSMLVKDVAPDRLTAAKAAAYDLLDRFPEDRIGLLAFAGSASLQAPLTVDHNALRETLDQLDINNVPSGGSNLAEAIHLATKTFKDTGQSTHGLIVLSDGELHEGELAEASSDARKAGVFVVAIGLGTLEGDFVPDPEEQDGRFRDRSGNPVLSRLNSAPLRTLAGETQGLYLDGVGNNFGEKIDTVVSRLDAFEAEGQVQVTPVPRFQWFLIPAIFLMIASLFLRFLWAPARPKGIPAAVTPALVSGMLLAFDTPAEAAEGGWLDQFFNSVTQPAKAAMGSRLLKSEEPAAAIPLYEDAAKSETGERLARTHFGEGMAHYQTGHYQQAADAFGQALLSESPELQRDAHFQLANTLYHRGLAAAKAAANSSAPSPQASKAPPSSLLADAIENYDAALALDKDHEPSKKNREFVQQALQQQQKQEQQQEGEQQGSEAEDEEEDSEKSEGSGEGDEGEQEEQEGGEENQGDEGDEGDNGEEQNQGQNGEEEENGEGGDQQGQEPQGQSGQQQGAQAEKLESDRENESPEDFARRILEENADFQKEALRKRGRQQTPTKDW